MKKKIIYLGVALVMLFSITGLTACGWGQHKLHETGYFQYIIIGQNSRFPQKSEDGIVAIVGLTESGKLQEVIDIPRIIDEKNVRYIGYGPITQKGFAGGYYNIESPKLKKIFIHDNIDSVY